MISLDSEVNHDRGAMAHHFRLGSALLPLPFRSRAGRSAQDDPALSAKDGVSDLRQAATLRSAVAAALLAGTACVALSFIGGVNRSGGGMNQGTQVASKSSLARTPPIHLVYTLSSSSHGLPQGVAALEYSKASESGALEIVTPSWTPYPDSSGAVKRGGDIAVIDDSTVGVNLNLQLEVENLKALESNYKSFSFPIDIYRCDPDIGLCGTHANPWTAFKTAQSGTGFVVSNKSPVVTTTLQRGYLYDLTMDAGQGHYQTTSVSNPKSSALSPAFLITASSHTTAR